MITYKDIIRHAYRGFVKDLLESGINFHPDTQFEEYEDREGRKTFARIEAKKLNKLLEGFTRELKDEVYTIGLEEFNAEKDRRP